MTYDALGRRMTLANGAANLTFIHDGASVIGSSDSVSGNTWSFMPGGLAGSLTSGGAKTTWVPLLDTDGSTIALVNSAQNSQLATTFTYDPSGVPTVGGLANSFPFLYQGLEHEVTDPGQLDFEPSGNVYNPQIQRELSQVGEQGIGGPPSGGGAGVGGGGGPGNGGFGNFGPGPGRGQTGNSLGQTFSELGTVASPATLLLPDGLGFLTIGGGDNPISIPIFAISDLFNLFGYSAANIQNHTSWITGGIQTGTFWAYVSSPARNPPRPLSRGATTRHSPASSSPDTSWCHSVDCLRM